MKSSQSKLGAKLRDLRQTAGLSGMEAAQGAGITQSTISRIERGLRLPSTQQVEKLSHIYGTSDKIRHELVELAANILEEESSHRIVLQRSTWRIQQRVKNLEHEATRIRIFHPSIVIGLLQTSDYIRSLYGDSRPKKEIDQAVSLRLERQKVLNSGGTFTIIMAEGALRWQIGSPSVMVTQLEYLAEVSRLPNVQLGIVPWTTATEIPALHGFHLLDNTVLITTLKAVAFISRQQEVKEYEETFEEFESLASFDDHALSILEKIANDYRQLL